MSSTTPTQHQLVQQTAQTMQMADALVRLPIVIEVTGLSKSSIRRRIEAGSFPKPIKDGARCTRWRAGDVTNWLRARVSANVS